MPWHESECLIRQSRTPIIKTVVVYGWSRVFLYPPKHWIAHTERVAMSTNTREVRRFALFISAITAISLAISGCSSQPAQVIDQQPKTSQFVLDSFQDGQFLTPFEAGKAEIGLTLEALTNLSLLGYTKEQLDTSIDWATSNTALLTSPGLKATYVFTAYAAGFGDHPTVPSVLFDLKAAIDSEGYVEDTNNFAYSWIVLALIASENNELASKVAVQLANNAESTGGYKYTKGDDQSAEAADVTSFAVMAIKATEGFGSESAESTKSLANEKSLFWLKDNLVEGTHYVAYDALDLAGTSYGAMALIASDEDATKSVEWLASQINETDSGIPSAYSEGASDVFTSVQALLPLSSLTFIDVVNKINNERNKDNS